MNNAMIAWRNCQTVPDAPLYPITRGAPRSYAVSENAARRAHTAAQDLSAAAKFLEGLVGKYPDVLDYRFDLGRIYTAQGELAADPGVASPYFLKARNMFEETVKRNPENVQYRQALGELDALTKASKP